MAKIGNLPDMRKIKESVADQTADRIVADHIVSCQIVQDLLIGQAE